MFGSYANDCADKFSDIDIMLMQMIILAKSSRIWGILLTKIRWEKVWKPLWCGYRHGYYHYIGVWNNRSDKFECNKTNKYLKIKKQHKQCKKRLKNR